MVEVTSKEYLSETI
uniref:Uncharacterized protein n=1 Tax=Rhizophora mucronata TaxID=61149 RepID=A0A2P2P4R4_RHIMU